MKFYEIAVTTDTASSELVADAVYTNTDGQGVVIVDKNDLAVPTWDYAEDGLAEKMGDKVLVKGFCGIDKLNQTVNDIKSALNSLSGCCHGEIAVRLIDDNDWADEWKKYYFPVEIGSVVVCPVWLNDGNPKNVLIDTGLAFGTGQHETTAECIRLMQNVDLNGKTVLDVGCGSGVLGLTAVHLNAKTATLVDNDSQACETALNNAKLNGYSDKVKIVCGNLADGINDKYDVVCANLTAPILLLLNKDVDAVVKDGTQLILSGILNECSAQVEQAYARFTLVEKLQQGIWTGLRYVVETNGKGDKASE